jgi:hypothetical protein
MKTIEINKKGEEFIANRSKQVKQTMYIFPIFLILSICVGVFKLGFSEISIFFILLTFPVFFIGLYNAAIKPNKILKNIINKINIDDDKIIFYSTSSIFKPSIPKRKGNLNVFNVTFLEYYTEKFNSEEYYLIPDFFDDFNIIETKLKLSSNRSI